MKITIENNELVIRCQIPTNLQPSSTGKSLIVASTQGNQTFGNLTVQGSPVTIGLNAYIPNKAHKKAA